MSTLDSPSPSPRPSASPVTAILSPSKKVQALLAQFSDSETEDERPSRNAVSQVKPAPTREPSGSADSSELEDDIQPRGRLTARLAGAEQLQSAPRQVYIHPNRVSPASQLRSATGSKIRSAASVTSDDEVATAGPIRRRLLTKRKSSPAVSTASERRLSRSGSPLLSPSPQAGKRDDKSADFSPKPTTQGTSKFLALVEKHRTERFAREAAEVIKRAFKSKTSSNKTPPRARGSSPADDSNENDTSDDQEAVKRIQHQSKPTRKASKKALEEINRETQRMSRNMQLAHQAKTKKKITKESLLARFNLQPTTTIEPSEQMPVLDRSSASNSASASNSDVERGHQTPPTSPMKIPDDMPKTSHIIEVKDLSQLLETGEMLPQMGGALTQSKGISDPEAALNQDAPTDRMRQLLDYRTNDRTVLSPKSKQAILAPDTMTAEPVPAHKQIQNVQINPVRRVVALAGETGSDDEIEIVCERGLKRKYAAFESLPKRKAKEMPSHLALRSLAHLMNHDDKKRSINAAELEAGLRRKARLQALQERRDRIEALKAKGVIIQSAEERERDLQEVEDLVERARQEAVEIQKREKELAKKDGTYIKDNLDDDDNESGDSDFDEELEGSLNSESDEASDNHESNDEDRQGLIDDEVEEADSEGGLEPSEDESKFDQPLNIDLPNSKEQSHQQRLSRKLRVISDDEDDEEKDNTNTPKKPHQTPTLMRLAKTPISAPKSARKIIPGLQMSDDLPMGLSQAFAATMAGSQSEDVPELQQQDSLDVLADLPSPRSESVPPLRRLDSLDLVSDSQPSASQTQPLNITLFSQSQVVPESPRVSGATGVQYTPSQRQMPFDLTQDNGYVLSPFTGNRFSETPNIDATYSTAETVMLSNITEGSPIVQRKRRLQRRLAATEEASSEEDEDVRRVTAFEVMQDAAKRTKDQPDFDKKKSEARNIVDEAAEESEDEYAGLGGASDESGDDEENEEDRRLIDQDTQIGKGDEAKLAGFYADRERERDEKEVSKLLKDITTGALRRKRGVGDDLDLSDEEDAAARRREAKRREFAKMRRELLKDEAVGKIAEDKKKEAFLRSIEDREVGEDEEDFEGETLAEPPSHGESQSQGDDMLVIDNQDGPKPGIKDRLALNVTSDSKLNSMSTSSRRNKSGLNRKPATLAEIRESVSFLVEEPDSQAAMIDLGLSDSEDEPEAYVDLDRHFKEAEADENALDEEDDDLGDFIIDDEPHHRSDSQGGVFKKPELPGQERAPFAQRRTKNVDVVDRLSLLRQASSSASSTGSTTSASTKMAFFSSKTAGLSGAPSLLRRATTNSSLGSMSGRENVSATGVVTSKTERGSVGEEKEFVRKGSGGRRNAVNYQGERRTLREEKMSARAGVIKTSKTKKGQGFLGGLFRGDSWE